MKIKFSSIFILLLVVVAMPIYGNVIFKGSIAGQIYYVSTERHRTPTRIVSAHKVISIGKGKESSIFESSEVIDGIALSNSGKTIVLSQGNKLVFLDTGGKEKKSVEMPNRVGMKSINWGLDDKELYFVDFEAKKLGESEDGKTVQVEWIHNIYKYDIESGEEQRLTNYTAGNVVDSMVFLPEADAIFYLFRTLDGESESNDLVKLDLVSGASVVVGHDGDKLARGPGDKELLVVRRYQSSLKQLENEKPKYAEVFIFNSISGAFRPIFKAPWIGDLVASKRDNAILFFKSLEDGGGYPNWSLFLYNLESGKMHQLLERDEKIKTNVMWHILGTN